jgi:hypothetical protein
MAVQEQRASNNLEKYIAEVRAVWGDGKDPQLPFKVAALMEKLFASTRPDDPWMAELIRDGKPSRELYRDPDHGFIQMGHIHKQGHGNQPHDHGPCWVVYGSYKGVTEITKYKRTDDGSGRESQHWRKKGSIAFLRAWCSRICGGIFTPPTPSKGPASSFVSSATTWTRSSAIATTGRKAR